MPCCDGQGLDGQSKLEGLPGRRSRCESEAVPRSPCQLEEASLLAPLPLAFLHGGGVGGVEGGWVGGEVRWNRRWGERPHLNKVDRDFLCAEETEGDLDGAGQAGRRAS